MFAIFVALALMVAMPLPTPVTGTLTMVAPAAKVTEAGTVATLVLVELVLMVGPPLGAAGDTTSVRFCVPVPVMDRLEDEKPMVNVGFVTVTLAEVFAIFVALALMVAMPAPTPVTGTLTVVAPAAKDRCGHGCHAGVRGAGVDGQSTAGSG